MTTDYDAVVGSSLDINSDDYNIDGQYGVEVTDPKEYGERTWNSTAYRQKDMATIEAAHMEAQSAIDAAMINYESARDQAIIEGKYALEAQIVDAKARCYEADKNFDAVEIQAKTDLEIANTEAEVEYAKIELEYEKLEVEKYRIDNVDAWRAMSEYQSSEGDKIEAQGEYAESIADASQTTDGGYDSWNSAL